MGIPAAGGAAGTPPAGDLANAVVLGSFSAAGQSASFSFWGPFNVALWGAGAAGSVQLERSFDGGTTWIIACYREVAAQMIFTTFPFSTTAWEPERGVLYRLNCTSYTGSAIDYRMSTTGAAATAGAAGARG